MICNSNISGGKLKYILLVGLLLRLAYMPFAACPEQAEYWEYGTLAKNFYHSGEYAFYHYDNQGFRADFDADAKPFPSALMPPLYVFYLLPFMAIENEWMRNILLLLIQNLAAVAGIFFLYRLSKQLFNENTALISSGIASFLPAFIYASNTFGPTAFYLFLVPLFLYLLSKTDTAPSPAKMLLPAIICGTIILLRSEFALFAALLILYWLLKKQWKSSMFFLLITWLMIAPWQIRNYQTFDTFIPLTTNSGINLYRGHNPEGHGTWGEHDRLLNELPANLKNHHFERHLNTLFTQKALAYIAEHPGQTLLNSFEKLLYLWTINPDDNRSFLLFYFIPWVLLLAAFIVALSRHGLKLIRREHQLFFLHFMLTAMIFFVLPRYQVLMSVMMIPYASVALTPLFPLQFGGSPFRRSGIYH